MDVGRVLEQSVFIDSHCHQPSVDAAISLISLDYSQWQAAQTLPAAYSLGIHPWSIANTDWAMALQQLASFQAAPALRAIGECGLDRAIDTPLALQQPLFEAQIVLSEQWRKPLIIHCVRAFECLLQLKKHYQPKQAWVIHGFNANATIAQQCLAHGCYLGFGSALLNPDSHASRVLPSVPLDRLLLESDASGMPIRPIYAAAAKIRALSLLPLQQQLYRNFTHLFCDDRFKLAFPH